MISEFVTPAGHFCLPDSITIRKFNFCNSPAMKHESTLSIERTITGIVIRYYSILYRLGYQFLTSLICTIKRFGYLTILQTIWPMQKIH